MSQPSSYISAKPYVPSSLSEIYDLLGSMILGAPTFASGTSYLPGININTEFAALTEGFTVVRKKLGEERYAALLDLAARAKLLFAEDQDDTNGKTDQGRALLFEIEDLLNDVRRRRVEAKLPDEEGEVNGD